MPAIDFPSGAQSGDLHVSAGKTWTFNGSGWVLVTIPSAMFSTGAVAGSSLTEDSVPLNKLVNSDAAKVVMYNASGVATATAISGDISITHSGVLTIDSDVISNTHIANGAEINPEKIAGTAVVLTDQAVITSYMIEDGTIVDGDISSDAGIGRNKLAEPLTNAQAASYTLVLSDRNTHGSARFFSAFPNRNTYNNYPNRSWSVHYHRRWRSDGECHPWKEDARAVVWCYSD